MKDYKVTEDFELSQYDFDFRFTAFDYILMGLYALFVLPFVLLTTLASKLFLKYKDTKKDHNEGVEFMSPIGSELTMASCCPWPRKSQKQFAYMKIS